MKILYITLRLPYGEGESFIVPEIGALLADGHEVMVVPRLSTDPVVHDDEGAVMARTRRLPGALVVAGAVAGALALEPRRAARAVWRLRRSRPRRRILFNAMATAQGTWIAGVARAWGADHIHAHWAHLTVTMAMAASEVSGISWSFTAHRYDVVLNNLLSEKLESAKFGRFIAREMLEIARPWLTPKAGSRAVVLHMGVELPGAPGRATEHRTVPAMLCPARLVPVKGHRHLLEAASLLSTQGRRFELWLAGDGPEAAALTRCIADAGLGDRVRMLGTVPHDALIALYRRGAVDCVVLPSVDLGQDLHEGLSVALIEAMAHGIPVVSTRTGGLPELLEGGAGLLVPGADPAALAAALDRLLGSAALRQELGQAGRRRIAEQFNVATIARDLARMFADTSAEASAPDTHPERDLRSRRPTDRHA